MIYDAEHFFDGYKDERIRVSCLRRLRPKRNRSAGLCDTNGGTLPHELAEIVRDVIAAFPARAVGIHTHNDTECGLPTRWRRCGRVDARPGTVNGYGERCGNCNLIPVVASLRLKLGYDCLLEESLAHLTGLAQYVDEMANLTPDSRRPYVGRSAFAHKGGVHADAVLKGASYEHIDPEAVGNSRRLLVSELAGSSSIAGKAVEYGFDLNKKSPEARALLRAVAERENEGYSYEGAEGSFELLMMQALGTYRRLFELKGFRCIVENAVTIRSRSRKRRSRSRSTGLSG